MIDKNEVYDNPLISRYASKEMSANFSNNKRFTLWRELWVALAESEKELGLGITDEQISELKKYVNNLNLDVADAREKVCRHDVMAHVYAYSMQCPTAAPIIHLGATSCYVTDNSDIIIYRDAIKIIEKKLVNVIDKLATFATKYKDMPTLGFTHLQPAQLVTVGKRATLWTQDLISDYEDLMFLLQSKMKMRGVKGTTGTGASFMQLFENDFEKFKKLNELVTKKMGFESFFAVSGQTYTRKLDYCILTVLSSISQSASKFANDIRILQNMKEIEEPFEKSQIGSSAMAYKRNPMRSERLCSIARYVQSLPINAAFTASTQWFERTLDDSANRRIVMGQAFMGVDAILSLYLNIIDGLVVYDKIIKRHIDAELPFMSTEVILMECVKAGGNRQELHEAIREHSMEAGKRVKMDGLDNDLIDRIKKDSRFSAIHNMIDSILDPINFIGASSCQVDDFITTYVNPLREKYISELGQKSEINV